MGENWLRQIGKPGEAAGKKPQSGPAASIATSECELEYFWLTSFRLKSSKLTRQFIQPAFTQTDDTDQTNLGFLPISLSKTVFLWRKAPTGTELALGGRSHYRSAVKICWLKPFGEN